MADSKISALPAAATLTGAELVPVVQSGNSVRSTVSAMGNNALGTYTPPGIGAQATTVSTKLAQVVSVFDFMTAAQIADVVARTLTQDVTAAIQAAINAYPAGSITLYAPLGSYKITASVVFPNGWYQGRLMGAGYGTIFKEQGAASFDMFTFANPGAGLVNVNNIVIDNCCLDGSSLTGAGNLINTANESAIQMRDLLLINLPLTGNGINVVGNGATYSHDILVSNLYYNTTTGNAIVFMGATSSDSILERIKGNGQLGCKYGIYFATGSAHCHVANSHPYNHSLNALFIGANAGSHWFMDCRFENCLQDSAQLASATLCSFTACVFSYAPTNFAGLLLVNSNGNKFSNTTFTSGGVSKYAVNETGTSGQNVFNGYTLEGAFTVNPPFVLINPLSALRASGTDFILSGGPTGITAGSTIYITNGPVASTIVGAPCLYGGLLTQLVIECDTAPGAGQTFTATVMNNGVATALVATISGAAAFSAAATAVIPIAATNSTSIRVVASAGAAASNVRASAVVNQ